jgi:hypothetical protein
MMVCSSTSVWQSRVAAAILAALLSGCALVQPARLHVAIRNNTDAPAFVQMVEFDFATGEFGAPLGDATTIPASKSARLGIAIPAAGPWALRINDLPAVTSLGLADNERSLPGQGPLAYSVSVDDGGLSTTVSRANVEAGETSAPDPN